MIESIGRLSTCHTSLVGDTGTEASQSTPSSPLNDSHSLVDVGGILAFVPASLARLSLGQHSGNSPDTISAEQAGAGSRASECSLA